MSSFPAKDPVPGDAQSSDAVAHVIVPRSVDLGSFQVHRALPSAQSRMVGPFIFFDHFGPAVFSAGDGIDVRPHPHIGLATVTYLVEGEIVHRDSLGSAIPIHPGAVNWMTAGRGIVHSERSGAESRAKWRVHGGELARDDHAEDGATVGRHQLRRRERLCCGRPSVFRRRRAAVERRVVDETTDADISRQ